MDFIKNLLFKFGNCSRFSKGSLLFVAANSPPPKPWEQAGSSSGPAPFKPPSAGNTSDVVEASGTAKPGEIVSGSDRTAAVNRNSLGRPVPTRPWEQNYGNNTYGGGLFLKKYVLAVNLFLCLATSLFGYFNEPWYFCYYNMQDMVLH